MLKLLKRCQVLLYFWQIDYLRKQGKKYDLGFSTLVRLAVSAYIGYGIEPGTLKERERIEYEARKQVEGGKR